MCSNGRPVIAPAGGGRGFRRCEAHSLRGGECDRGRWMVTRERGSGFGFGRRGCGFSLPLVEGVGVFGADFFGSLVSFGHAIVKFLSQLPSSFTSLELREVADLGGA